MNPNLPAGLRELGELSVWLARTEGDPTAHAAVVERVGEATRRLHRLRRPPHGCGRRG